MRKIAISALAVLVIVLMLLSTIPVIASEDSGDTRNSTRGSLEIIYQEDFSAGAGGWYGKHITPGWFWYPKEGWPGASLRYIGPQPTAWGYDSVNGYMWRPRVSGNHIDCVYSQPIDMSKCTGNAQISWRHYQSSGPHWWGWYGMWCGIDGWVINCRVDISKDNGATWLNLYGWHPVGWSPHTEAIPDDYLVSDLLVRFTSGDMWFGWSGWTFGFDDVLIEGEVGIPATVDVKPETLNLKSEGKWVTIKVLDFPENPEYDVDQVIDGTIMLENIPVLPEDPTGGGNDGQYMCKAERLALEDYIGAPDEEVELTVTGDVAGTDGVPDTSFEGICTIDAIHGT